MWSIVLIGFLLRPVTEVEAGQPADEQLPITAFANLLRGRVLALSLKKGMTHQEVLDRVGFPTHFFSSHLCLCWHDLYDCLGVAIDYETEWYGDAKKGKRQSQ